VVDPAVAEHLEVLGTPTIGLGAIAEGVAMLTPSIGLCDTPSTTVGCRIPAASSTVGATSIT
jgi:hypothetical protein